MKERKEEAKESIKYSIPVITILITALGYFVYGGLEGALAIFILDFLLTVCILFSLIPFFGVILQYCVSTMFVIPFVFDLTGIYSTWLTNLIFGISMVYGLLVCIIMTFVVVLTED